MDEICMQAKSSVGLLRTPIPPTNEPLTWHHPPIRRPAVSAPSCASASPVTAAP